MSNASESDGKATPWHVAFWRTLKRFDRSKVNNPSMALRNALAAGLPLAIGIALGHPLGGVAVASGALNVSYSDGNDPYAHRARRMLAWSFLGAFAVFLASVTGNYHVLAILIASLWALVAGLLVSISTRAADLGLNTLVVLIVYAARGAMSPKGALYAGLLVLAGALLQTSLALLFWPLRRSLPERLAVGKVYLGLAQEVGKDPSEVLASPLKSPSGEVQDTLSALGRDHSLEGERFRLLFDQADRLRFSIYSLSRLRAGLKRARQQHATGSHDAVDILDQLLELSRKILDGVGQSLLRDDRDVISPELLKQAARLAEEAQSAKSLTGSLLVADFASAADILTGQLRVVAQLAANTTTQGAEEFAKHEFAPPLKLQLRSWLATLRANLHLRSPAFRHGIRLAVCVAIGDAIGRSIGTQRNYWLAMTVAVVLKPDFTTTISRGILRLCGTFTGLALATILFHAFPASALTQLVLVSVFTFFMRYVGPANYGIFSVAISGLIVFLIAATGVAPGDVIAERAINTAAGGVFALIAYSVWPTWERIQVSEVIAEMIDRSREYFRLVMRRLEKPTDEIEAALDKARDAWRQARSNAEASVDRFCSEPGAIDAQVDCLTSILASSHVLLRSMMALEAGISQNGGIALSPALETFGHHVEFTLYFLSAALRGSSSAAETLPKLRDDHRQLLESYRTSSMKDDYLLLETDRLIVSLNTLREQVMRCVALQHTSPLPVLAYVGIKHTSIK
jgi:uncharacterized membrane protein YccC